MANIRITDLDLIPFSTITVDDVFPLVDVSGNTTYKINLNQLKLKILMNFYFKMNIFNNLILILVEKL